MAEVGGDLMEYSGYQSYMKPDTIISIYGNQKPWRFNFPKRIHARNYRVVAKHNT